MHSLGALVGEGREVSLNEGHREAAHTNANKGGYIGRPTIGQPQGLAPLHIPHSLRCGRLRVAVIGGLLTGQCTPRARIRLCGPSLVPEPHIVI